MKSRIEKKEYKIIEASNIAKQFAKLKKVKSERQYLQKRLDKVGEWLPLLQQIKADTNAEKLLEELHKRLAEKKQLQLKLRKEIPVWNPPGDPPILTSMSSVHPSVSNLSPFGWRLKGDLLGQIPEYQPPTVVTGAIKYPADFYVYKWSDPAAGWGNDNDFKWDLLRSATRQERASGLSWIGDVDETEAVTCAYGARLISTVNGSPYRLMDSMAAILGFVYSFPAPQHDSALYWSVQLSAYLDGVGIWGNGAVSLEPVVSTTEEIHFEAYNWLEPVWVTEPFDYRRAWYWDIGGIIDVTAGSTASLTIGLSVYLQAMDPDFEMGVGYIGDWRGETYTGDTSDIDTNALWNEGTFSVRYDRGFTGPTVGRYRPGVQYEMVPLE